MLQPVIRSRTVQMRPAAILPALTAGASIAGILGMLLSVPLTAAAFGVLSELRSRYGDGGPGRTRAADGDRRNGGMTPGARRPPKGRNPGRRAAGVPSDGACQADQRCRVRTPGRYGHVR